MTQIFDKKGNVIPCTIIDVNNVKFIDRKEKQKHGYDAVILGIGEKKHKNKAELGKYKELKCVPRKVVEFRVDDLNEYDKYKIGDKIEADIFTLEDKIKVTGITKGKGFQGVVKRWGFKGGQRTHGQSDRKRAPGSIGAGTDPGRVWKGKKMPGHMGMKVKSIMNLKVEKVDKENGLICVKGAVPGSRNSIIKLYK